MRNHNRTDGVWLVTWKKSTPQRYVSRDAVLDALVAFGWIDGRRMKLDEHRTMQFITPRRTTRWADSYVRRAQRLAEEGRMRPAGQRAIDDAKEAGGWTVLAHVDQLLVPDELANALAAEPGAETFFRDCAPSYRRNVLRWLAKAKRAPTRAKRVTAIVAHAARREKVPQF
ncbi:MAG: YdeI/OmpD-associated family protein [Myxococcota bacterium]